MYLLSLTRFAFVTRPAARGNTCTSLTVEPKSIPLSLLGNTEMQFDGLSNKLLLHVFQFLGARELARAREVCNRWNFLAADECLWKKLCVAAWAALQYDQELWQLVDRSMSLGDANCWRNVYPKIENTPKWTCRLQKTNLLICNLVAHRISTTSTETL